jgi:hypothetical protein
VQHFPPDVQEYINGPEFRALYPFDLFLLGYDRPGQQSSIRPLCLRMLLHRELTWMLAYPILEQLQTLVIPVSDVNRYLGVLDRLGQLRCVHFFLDEVYDYHPSEAGRATEEWIARAQARKDKPMKLLLQFVERHTQLFKGQLRIVTCHPRFIWSPYSTRQTCPTEVQFQLLQLVPPLHNPTTLDASNEMHFAAHIEATNIGHVEDITLTPPAGAVLDRLCANRQFLQRCRVARHLHLTSLGKGSFKWAIDEKRAVKESMGNNTLILQQGSSPLPLQYDDRPACLQHGLVPLEDVWIGDLKDASTDEVDDIAIAFSETLRNFRVSVMIDQQDIPPVFHFGRGWVDMTVLVRLSLDTSGARMVLDRELLVRCPNLTFARLNDMTSHYQCSEIVPSAPAQLSRVVTLWLDGWSGLTFHPDTLYSTSELRTLHIGMIPDVNFIFDHEHCFIPPVEELNQSYNIGNSNDNAESAAAATAAWEAPQVIRPRWTWDWQLPHLTKLRFCGESAYLFEFRMLRGCPALEKLHLDMLTPNLTHTRTLSMVDLIIPSSNINNNSDSSIGGNNNGDSPSSLSSPSATVPERIILPTLRDLKLKGNWIIEDEFLFELLGVTFPKLAYLTALGWLGITLGGLLSVARAVAQPWKQILMAQPEPDRDTWAELGLVDKTEFRMENQVMLTELIFNGVEGDIRCLITQEPGASVATASENE